MDKKDYIKSKLPESDGLTVPSGYFEDFEKRMAATIADMPFDSSSSKSESVVLSRWQRIRPYVYMAAMFAGVWCMLKLFTLFTSTTTVPFESNPIVAEAFNNDKFVNEYVISDLNQWDLYDDLYEDGIDLNAFLDSIALSEMDVPAEYIY